jgi:hypothetical protein
MTKHYTMFGSSAWGVAIPALTFRQRLEYKWLDFRIWLEDLR